MSTLRYDMKTQYKIFKRILTFVYPYKGRLILGVLLSALSGIFDFSPVLMLKWLFDKFIENKANISLSDVYCFCIVIILVYIIKGVITYAQQYLLAFVGQRVIKDVRNLAFEYISNLPLRYFKGKKSGELMSRILNDISLMEMAVSQATGRLVLSIFSFFPPLIAVFYFSWQMAFVSLFILPISLYPIMKFAQKLKSISSIGQGEIAKLSSVMHETFYGIQIVKAFNMEEYEFGRFRKSNKAYYNEMMRAARVSALSPTLMELIGAIAAAIIFATGLKQVIDGTLTSGDLFAFLTSLFLMYDPIKKISRLSYDINRAVAGAERIFELLDTPSDLIETESPHTLSTITGKISFNNVSFSYEPDQPVLQNINFKIHPGETIAIVGASGVGKSTLVNLLPRFYDPTEGSIHIDDVDLRDLSIKELRSYIGVVTQETILFNDSIRSNITCGQKDIPEENIVSAATSAFIHDFIHELPNGYDTVVGERGISLSGGQRQRISIARALLKNPPILILDEATSSLDSESEQLIQKALDELIRNRTTIVIAHRLSTIRKASRIFAMEDGRIVEIGSHEELLALNGTYRKLHDLQFPD
ncbi:MAG: ABC transporter ATP-binding protein [bacterium]